MEKRISIKNLEKKFGRRRINCLKLEKQILTDPSGLRYLLIPEGRDTKRGTIIEYYIEEIL